jgi:hypothetical protein
VIVAQADEAGAGWRIGRIGDDEIDKEPAQSGFLSDAVDFSNVSGLMNSCIESILWIW